MNPIEGLTKETRDEDYLKGARMAIESPLAATGL